MRSRRGATIVDVMITMVLVTIAGLVFSATFPTGFSAVRQGGERKKAVAIAQRKLEQVKALGYENLTYDIMHGRNMVDDAPTTSPYSFSAADGVDQSLPSPVANLDITDSGTTAKWVTVTVSWSSDNVTRSVVLRTLVADKRSYRRS